MIPSFVGIDYGSKTSGNTVICYHDGQVIQFCDAEKKKRICLSLPAVHHSRIGFSNYYYRQYNVALKAMSPLFLGGLTVRAMEPIVCYELKQRF